MLLEKLKQAFGRAHAGLSRQMRNLLGESSSLDAATMSRMEEILLKADLGPEVTQEILERTQHAFAKENILPGNAASTVMAVLQSTLRHNLLSVERGLRWDVTPPTVFCVAGVNGSGKTTTCAKLAHRFMRDGRSVVLGACDTFRAAAADQLEIWARRVGAFVVRGQSGADPASVAYDALAEGIACKADAVVLDTAGRLHTKDALMEEAKKILRVIHKLRPSAPSETLLVLDATNGQNAVAQVGQFHAALHLSGLVLAKMDAGAKAGVAVALERKYGIPVKCVGTGEAVEDLEFFDPDAFVEALVSTTPGP